ncbi:MAG: TIGR00269 family protein [Candidatus Aenigmatarchaeota archaeon]|nr:MAG: TIGR00269 family protein [Candidatus Aenigmarchaeota archaeon]
MNCSACEKDAVYHRKYEGRALCKEHFSEDLLTKIRRTIRTEQLIKHGDKICVALSGGKDSSLTLYVLSDLLKTWPNVELFALAVDEGIEGYRDKSLESAKELCARLGVRLHVVSYKDEFGKTMDQVLHGKKDFQNADSEGSARGNVRACTYCGVFRRNILNKYARELGATKVATGHNLDDELQSVFMDFLKGDVNRLVRMGTTMNAHENDLILRVKPLRNVPEREIGLFCILNGLPHHEDECPNAHDSLRFDVRDFLNRMEERYPGTKHNASATFEKVLPALRESFMKQMPSLRACEKCGELCSGETCKACELKATI